MPFTRYADSEDHEVVEDEERDAIRRVAGNRSAEQLAEAEKDRLLAELEAARQH